MLFSYSSAVAITTAVHSLVMHLYLFVGVLLLLFATVLLSRESVCGSCFSCK